jgi:hypothetical protein
VVGDVNTIGGNLEFALTRRTTCNCISSSFYGFRFATATSDLFQVFEIAWLDRGHIFSAENPNLEFPVSLAQESCRKCFKACILEISKILEDDFIRSNMLCDDVGVALVGDKFGRRSEINSVDVGMPKN